MSKVSPASLLLVKAARLTDPVSKVANPGRFELHTNKISWHPDVATAAGPKDLHVGLLSITSGSLISMATFFFSLSLPLLSLLSTSLDPCSLMHTVGMSRVRRHTAGQEQAHAASIAGSCVTHVRV